jgi:hypothetical protein
LHNTDCTISGVRDRVGWGGWLLLWLGCKNHSTIKFHPWNWFMSVHVLRTPFTNNFYRFAKEHRFNLENYRCDCFALRTFLTWYFLPSLLCTAWKYNLYSMMMNVWRIFSVMSLLFLCLLPAKFYLQYVFFSFNQYLCSWIKNPNAFLKFLGSF